MDPPRFEAVFENLGGKKVHSSGIPGNSLAESAHAKMKWGGQKNLVEAAQAACVMFEVKWQRRMNGERSTLTEAVKSGQKFLIQMDKS